MNLLNSTVTLFHTKNHELLAVPLNNTPQEMFARRLEGGTDENRLVQFYYKSVGEFLVMVGKHLKRLVELKGIEPSAS